MKRSLPVYVLVASISTACLGQSSTTDLQAELASYPDKGRTPIDPVVPGTLTITFDDGPGPYTKGIIDVLTRHGISATFFVVGRNIPGNRDVLEYARQHGQQIGNHSYYHEPQPSLSRAEFEHRLRQVNLNIDGTDNGRLYFRFPYGAAGDEQLAWLSSVDFDGSRYRPVGWHVDSEDFEYGVGYPGDETSTNILKEPLPDACKEVPNPFQHDMLGWTQFITRKKRGGVMLFHDIKRITHDKLDDVLSGLESPGDYWAKLSPEQQATYGRFYDCAGVDRLMTFTFQSLSEGAYPSLLR